MLERLTGRAMIVTLCAVAALTLLGNLAVLSLPRVESAPDTYSLPGAVATLLGLFALVGAAIAWRQPRNGVGWIFLLAAAAGGIQGLAGNYGGYAIVERHRTLPGGDWAAWLAALALPFVVGPTTTLLILLFPDGRLPSPRWRPVFWFAFSALGVWAIALASLPGKFNSQQYTSNPLWDPDAAFPIDQRFILPLVIVLVFPAALLCAAGLVSRFREARGVQRQQLKWMAYAGAVVALGTFLVPLATSERKWLQLIQQMTVLSIPVAAGIAILRHHLYDIDLLINRTIVYGAVSATLGALYAGSVILLQPVLRPITSGSELAVAISTLGVLALFQPIRRRIQRAVDRRFYRSRYDAARTLDAFTVRLRDEVDLEAVRHELLDAVRETVQPAHATVWLRR